MKNFDTSNQATPGVKADAEGNSYLYNAIFTGVRANIVKLDKSGDTLWSAKLLDHNGALFYSTMYITVDDTGNVYGLTTPITYTGFILRATNGSFQMGSLNASGQELVAFKLDKKGNYIWSSVVSCYTAVLSGIVFDKYANMVYPVASYALSLTSDAGNLVSPAVQNSDLAQVAFFWSIDCNTGKTKALANLYVGLAGTIVPLPNKISYFTSNMYTYDVGGNYLQLDHKGNIQTAKPMGVSQLSQFQATDVSSSYYYDTGVTNDFSPIGYFDFRNRIRKFDLNGNSVKGTDFSMFDTISQQKKQVFSATGIKAINDKNVLFYGSNLNNFKTYFMGDSLAQYDFRLTFMDDNFNINKNIKCSSTSYLIVNSFDYDKADSSFYLLLVGNQANTIKIGSVVINVPTHDVNVNYTYLVKMKFDNVTLLDDTQPSIVSMVLDQQTAAATISDSLATVTATVGPGTNLSTLTPGFTLSEGTSFKTALPSPVDMSKPLNVTLVNSKGIERSWLINVNKTGSSSNNIDTIVFNNQLGFTRDTVQKSVNVLVDRTVDLHNAKISSYAIDNFATISPDPGSITDFSSPQTLTVTAENGNKATWTITVAKKLSSDNDILALTLKGQIDSAHIDDIDKIVTVRSNSTTTSIQNLKLSDGAVLIAPLNNTLDFSSPVTFDIKAEDGTIADWKVEIIDHPFSGLDIHAYPMPAFDVLNISMDELPKSTTTINFSSIFGTVLQNSTISPDGSPVYINVGNYPAGMYLLKVINSGHVYTKKIIVKH